MKFFVSTAMICALPAALFFAETAMAQDAPAPSKSARPPVVVRGQRRDDTPAKLDHILPEVAGTKITVTKKTTVTKLDQIPTVIDNNQRELFARTPGILVSEQQTPTQFNLSYRGLGNPQESEFVLTLQDGLPISTDWIGFPTLYYIPLTQSISEIQVIRAGSSLLYGPEPAPAVNFVSKRPKPGEALTGYTEQVVGSDGLYSTYNVLEGTRGPYEFRGDAAYVQTDAQRENATSRVRQGDLYLGYRPDGRSNTYVDLHLYDADSGDPGRIGYAQFKSDPSFSPTPFNHDWVERYSLTLGHDQDLGGGWRLEAKAWTAYQNLATRSAAAQAAGAPPPATTTLQSELFRSEGADVRLVDHWGRGNALTIGAVAYHDNAPFRQWTSPDILAAEDDHSGTPRLRQARDSYYGSVFAENVFRLPYRFHIVPSVRLEREEIDIDETVRPPTLVRPLIDVKATRNVPLFGIGLGNDFGNQNETYFSVTQGYRPLRFLDVASPFGNVQPTFIADPSKSVDYEAGVHGTPIKGLFYDAGLFWIDFDNRIETIVLSATDSINQNTGNTRHRGFEGELSYDFLNADISGRHLIAFANLSLLDARFTASDLPNQVGRVPAFAPHVLGKFGVTFRKDHAYDFSVTGVSVGSQFFQDSDLPAGAGASFVPAKVPSYTVVDFAGDYYLTRRVRLLAGVSNLGDERYYDRVFQNGIEPGLGRSVYGGVAFGF
jgi:Fe(3+) dicitrate transport protein